MPFKDGLIFTRLYALFSILWFTSYVFKLLHILFLSFNHKQTCWHNITSTHWHLYWHTEIKSTIYASGVYSVSRSIDVDAAAPTKNNRINRLNDNKMWNVDFDVVFDARKTEYHHHRWKKTSQSKSKYHLWGPENKYYLTQISNCLKKIHLLLRK